MLSMNLSRPTLLVLFLLTTVFSYAQEKKEIKPRTFKFGKIDPSDFKVKPGGADSAAAAVVLFDVGRGYFELSSKTGSFAYVFERHTRYKVINKNGYDNANLELQFYKQSGGRGETVLDQMDGAAYNMEDGKMVTSKINKDAKFTERQDKNFTLKKFALPNVKEGSVIEYKYRIKSDFIYTLRPWYFQTDIPTLYSEYEITIPEWFKYRVDGGGFVYLNPKTERINSNFGTSSGSESLACLKMSYKAEDVPALKQENFVPTMKDYVSRVGFELNSVTIPGQVYQEYTTTWPKVVKGLKEEENFGLFINKKSIFKTILKEKIKPAKSQDTLLLNIFDYVKNNIKWNEDENLYTSESNPKTVSEKKLGNSADINLFLLGLLNEAGIQASPVLLSTRDNGTHPGLPMLTKFNNVLVEATVNGVNVLLDATDKHLTPGIIGYNNLNHEGLKLDLTNTTSEWISLEETKPSRKTISYVLAMDTENNFTGKLYISTSNYEALRIRKKYTSAVNEEDYLKSFRTDKPGLSTKNYQIKNLNDPTEALIESMDVKIEDNIEEAGNLTYFTPLLYDKTKDNPFKLEERNFPVDFGYPDEEVYRLVIELPKGYQLDKSPKNEKVILPEENASFVFVFATEENRIMLNSKITFKKSRYSPEEYHYLKELFMNIVRKQSEQIVIKKS